mmetsp:Transcript_6921/g.30274  ORF Transcript_6921/g.30274 Transcript_6921/m.30274 type:complete len:84 (-) Transcript_6921:2508-2759(-)
MIDYERECSGGNEPTRQTLDRVEDARARYEEYSDRLTEASLHFEKQYREGTKIVFSTFHGVESGMRMRTVLLLRECITSCSDD